jgi:hypothetical protein
MLSGTQLQVIIKIIKIIDNLFAVASTIGNFQIFDVDKKLMILNIKDHNTAVNKIGWNPFSKD